MMEPKNSPELRNKLRKILARKFPDYFTFTRKERRGVSIYLQEKCFGKQSEKGRRAISNALQYLRKEEGYKAQEYTNKTVLLAPEDFIDWHICYLWGLFRKTPSKERAQVMKILWYLDYLKERGIHFARVLFMGTPTAITICPNERIHSFWLKLIPDNLWVALMLLQVSDILTIRVGDLVNLNKAIAKVRQWVRLLAGKGNFIVDHCPVNPESFEKEIHSEVKLAKGEPVLCVFMASGAGAGYMDRALRLSRKYPNLEVLLMTAGGYGAKHVWNVFAICQGEKRKLEEKMSKKKLAEYNFLFVFLQK